MFLYFIKSTFLLLIFLLIYRFNLQDKKSLHFNRFYLLITFVLGLIFPLLNFSFLVSAHPIIETKEVVFQHIEDFSDTQNFVIAENDYVLSTLEILFIIISSLFLLQFIFRVYMILRLKNTGKIIDNDFGNLVLHSKVKSPFSFLDSIYLNWESWELGLIEREILIHEKGHVVQKHSFDILFIEFFKVFIWFQPMLYFYKKAIQENHEFLADAYCLKQTNNIKTYQRIILNYYSEQNKQVSLSSSFDYKNLKKRFIMMKNTKKGNVSKVVFYTSALVFVYLGIVGIEGKAKSIEKIEASFSKSMNQLMDEEILQNVGNIEKNINSNKIENRAAMPKVAMEVFLNEVQDKVDAYYGNQVLNKTLNVFFRINSEGYIADVIIHNTEDIEIKNYITKILKDSPEWYPEIKNGVAIESKTMIPLRVKLEDDSNIIEQDPIEIKASPKDGMKAFYQNFMKVIEVPEIGEDTEFKAVVKMVVEEDGTLSIFEFINKEGFNEEFNNSVLKVLKTLPKWNPATKDGKAIATNFYLPITVKIAK